MGTAPYSDPNKDDPKILWHRAGDVKKIVGGTIGNKVFMISHTKAIEDHSTLGLAIACLLPWVHRCPVRGFIDQ